MTLQRNIRYTVGEFTWLAGAQHDQDFFDRLSTWDIVANFDHPGHGQPSANTLIGMLRHRLDIMRQQDAIFRGRPLQKHRISGLIERRVLNPKNVQLRFHPQYAAQHTTVEVLIREQAYHTCVCIRVTT